MPKRGRPNRGREEARLTVSVSVPERETINARAKAAGFTTSEWIRRIVLADPAPDVPSGESAEGE